MKSNEEDEDRQRLLRLLLDGASSPSTSAADAGYFEGLRRRVDTEAPRYSRSKALAADDANRNNFFGRSGKRRKPKPS